MKYNQRIENFLKSLSNDDFRLINDKKSEYYIHDNQIEVTREIILCWTQSEIDPTIRDRHSILLAKMQSGKTGVFMSLIYIINKYSELKNYFKIDNFSILTGMNDTGLEIQLKDRLINQCGLDSDYADRIVLKNTEMKNICNSKEPININNRLIIVDESHFGNNTEENILPKFLLLHGINQQNTSNLINKNVFFLSVSATPFPELSSDELATKNLIELKQSESYYGISNFFDNDLIFESKISNKNSISWLDDQIKNQYNRMTECNRFGAIIIRSNNKDIRNYLLKLNNWEIIEFHGKQIDYEKFNRQYLGEFEHDKNNGLYPKKPRIFLIKGTFRAGVSIISFLKKHIFAIFDSANSETHATAQGLIGRLCGYYNDEPITHFYVNTQAANEYAEWETNDFSRDYLPNNNKKQIIYSDEPSNIISGNHYSTSLLKLTEEEYCIYSNIKNNKELLLNFIKDLATKNEDINSNIIKDINLKYMYETYVYNKNTIYSDSVIKKWILPIKNSYTQTGINLLPRILKNVNFNINDIGNHYLHIWEDSNNDIMWQNTNSKYELISNKNLYIYIGKFCYKHFIKADLEIKEHLNTNI